MGIIPYETMEAVMGSGLLVTVGIPGCGKSTCLDQMLTSGTVDIVVSTDKIREQLTGDASNQDANGEVFRRMHGRIRAALSVGTLNVAVDATNLRPQDRATVKSFAGPGVRAVALRFSDSEDFVTCQQRNSARDRVVPDDVMERFYQRFMQDCSVETLLSEGWKVISL